MIGITAADIAAVAHAFDIDPRDVRGDTPLDVIGWTGSATDWLLAAGHLGVRLHSDPPDGADPATIADVVTIVLAAGSRADQAGH